MRISCDAQFKQYFYLYLLNFYDEYNMEQLEKFLKDYLMCHGVRIFIRDEHQITRAREVRDFDELMLFYNKYGEI